MSQNQNFFQGLMDFSFNTFVTQKLIRVIYGFGIVLLGISALVYVWVAFSNGFGSGILALVLAPIGLVIAITVLRIYLEIAIVLFRIADNTAAMARASNTGPGGPPHAT